MPTSRTGTGYSFSDTTEQLDWKASVRLATVAALPAYTQVTPTRLTANAAGAFPAIDGAAVVLGDRLLVKNEAGANQANHGIWTPTDLGSATTTWVLERTSDANGAANLTANLTTSVEEGTQADSTWQLVTNEPIVIGTTLLVFVMIVGPGGGAVSIVTRTTITAADHPYTVLVTDSYIEVNAVGGVVTVNLPAIVAAGAVGRRLHVVKTDASVNAVTVDGNAGETINGLAVRNLAAQYNAITIWDTGTEWSIE